MLYGLTPIFPMYVSVINAEVVSPRTRRSPIGCGSIVLRIREIHWHPNGLLLGSHWIT
jgi:hypothetical protein